MTVEVGRINLLSLIRITAAILFTICASGFASDTYHTPTGNSSTAPKASRSDILFVQTSNLSGLDSAQQFPEGSRIVRLDTHSSQSAPLNLTSEFFAAADPQVSFDATSVLFSGKKSGTDNWQVWEMDADGGHKRQITQCAQDCLRPGYLPEGEFVFTAFEPIEGHRHSFLAVANLDGSHLHAITFSPGDWWFETVLRDGRILASAASPLSVTPKASATRLFYTLRPDGAALDSFRCDHVSSVLRRGAEELEDGSIVFVSTPAGSSQAGGTLTEIQRGALQENKIGVAAGEFLSPRPYLQNQILVSIRQPKISTASVRFALYSFDLQKQLLGPVIYNDAGLSSIQPVMLASHPVPKKFWSTLTLNSKSGYFISLNSYSSAGIPGGRIASPIALVRVVAHQPGSYQERLLGEAPVEKDGSFYVEVPADQPVRFELLDANRQVIISEKSWIWARPGEQHGCAGCHGDKAEAPENRWPMTLRRFDTPTQLDQHENAKAH